MNDLYRAPSTAYQTLVGSIYDASLNPSLWRDVLETIRSATSAKHAVISFYDTQNRNRNAVMTAGASKDEEALYLKEYIDLDAIWLRKVFGNIPEGIAVPSQHFEEVTGLPQAQLFGEHIEFLQRVNIAHHAFAALKITENIVSAFSVHRDRTQSPFEPSLIEFLNSLAPHLCRAIRIYQQLNLARSNQSKLLDVLNQTNGGVLLLDSSGKVVFSNAEGGRILAANTTLRLGRHGKLQVNCSEKNGLLSQLVARVISYRSAEPLPANAHSLALPQSAGKQPLKVTVLPLANSELGQQLTHEQVAAVAFVTDPEKMLTIPQSYLREAYALTPAECEIAQAMLNGTSINNLAIARQTTRHTVRWQLKCILHKTATTTQSELIRLLTLLSNDTL